VRSIDDLRRAAQEGRLRDIRGLGLAVEKRVLTLLSKPQETRRFVVSDIEDEIESLVATLGRGMSDTRLAIAGSFRRRRGVVGDVDLLVAGSNAVAVGERLIGSENVADIRIHGPTRTTVVLRSGPQVDLRVIAEECWGAALLYFTGSKRHNVALRGLAGVRGWKLNEYGLFAGKRRIASEHEDDIYCRLGLQFIPPELREDRGEIAEARENRLPVLVDPGDIRGDLRVAVDWNEPTARIEPLVAAARAAGYRHLVLVGDGRRLHGSQDADLVSLRERIDAMTRRAQADAISLLTAVEADILPDGAVDLAPRVAALFDFVAAIMPSHLDLPAGEHAARLVQTIREARIGMLVCRRPAAAAPSGATELAFDRVVEAGRETACVLQLGADPEAPDLDEAQLRAAKASRVRIAIGTNASNGEEMRRMRFGVDQARRGWLSADEIANTQSAETLRTMLVRRP